MKFDTSKANIQKDVAAILDFKNICDADYRYMENAVTAIPKSIKKGKAIIKIRRLFKSDNCRLNDREIVFLFQGLITNITPDTKGKGTLMLNFCMDSITTKCLHSGDAVISRTSTRKGFIHIPFDIVKSITYIK